MSAASVAMVIFGPLQGEGRGFGGVRRIANCHEFESG